MEVIERLGLILFLIGLIGALATREEIMFWFTLIPICIGFWMFVGKDLKSSEDKG